jgi:hypothetical protein
VIARPDVPRGNAGPWQGRAAVYTAAAAISGTFSGAVLGSLGAATPLQLRVLIAMALAACAIAVGIRQTCGAVPVLQCNRETPRRWLQQGYLRAALKNGVALGNGSTTRVGFWSWYAIPLGALLIGDVGLSALVYGVYGTVRALAVWLWLALSRFAGDRPRTLAAQTRILMLAPRAYVLAGVALAGMSTAALVLLAR